MGHFAAGMLVPKAAVNEDSLPSPQEGYVWIPWHIFPMQAISVSKRMQQTANDHLRLGVLAPDSSHIAAAGCCIHPVHESCAFR